MTISAVVPVWNRRPLLARLLDTVEAQTLRADEVIAVDNGSTDGAAELAAERGCRVIAMGRNAGFAAAVNRGIGEARSEWVAVLNSDVELARDYFEKLTASGATFATGKILDARRNGVVDASFDLTCRGGTTWRAGNGRTDGPVFGIERIIASAPWTAAIFRAELFGKVGLLDESFESYLEDVEFGLRCAAHGIRGRYIPGAVAWHHGSASLGRWHPDTVRRIARNQVWISARYGAWWPSVVAQSLWGGVAVRHGGGAAWIRGLIEGLRQREKHKSVPEVLEHLIENEREIRALQSATHFDLYWRLYFLFTGGGAK
jgi:GT2 family glycosyltransferase